MLKIRVLLVDDHHLVRAGLRALVQAVSDCEVVGEAADGREAIQQAKLLKPDVVLMDILMPELNGLAATRELAEISPRTKVIALSMNTDAQSVVRSLRAGAAGYVSKDVSPVELELAIRAVADGRTYLSPSVSAHVINGCVEQAASPTDPLDSLTPRQREVLQLIAEGCTSKEIATKLNISTKTADTHRALLMQELGIHNIAGLVCFAIRSGLVSADG